MKWPEVQLSATADINPRRPQIIKIADDQPVTFVPMPAVSEVTAAIESAEERPYMEVKKGYTYFEENDILFSKITPCMENGKSALAIGLRNGIGFGSTEFHVLRANQNIILPQFLHYFIRQQAFRDAAKSRMRGGVGQQRVPKEFFDDIRLPVPSLSEQWRIVEMLGQADGLRKECSKAEAMTTRILSALFNKMFGDPATNPKGWQFKTLSEQGAQVRYGLGQPPQTCDGGRPLIRATNISRGTINPANMLFVDPIDVPPGRNAFLHADEVLVVRSGAYTGDIAQVTKKWQDSVAGYDLVITPGDSLNGEFLESFLLTTFIQNGYFKNLKVRGGQPHLNAAQLSATLVPVVPYETQNLYSEQVKRIRSIRQRLSDRKDQLAMIHKVLLHRAFTGELTARWRKAHMQEILAEMEQQAKVLNIELPLSN